MTTKSVRRAVRNATTRRATRRRRSGCNILKHLYLGGQIKEGQTYALDAYLKFLSDMRSGRRGLAVENAVLTDRMVFVLNTIRYRDIAKYRSEMYAQYCDHPDIAHLVSLGFVEVDVSRYGLGLTSAHITVDAAKKTASVIS